MMSWQAIISNAHHGPAHPIAPRSGVFATHLVAAPVMLVFLRHELLGQTAEEDDHRSSQMAPSFSVSGPEPAVARQQNCQRAYSSRKRKLRSISFGNTRKLPPNSGWRLS